MIIEIDNQTAKAISILNDRYYFDLFKNIRENTEQEYLFRDAISKISQSINNKQEERRIDASTCISNQHYRDIKRIVEINNLDYTESIEIFLQFGCALCKQNFKEPEEYYSFLDLFCIDRNLKKKVEE